MIPDERRKEILELLDEKGYVSVKDLSQRLYVSLPTIRRDLTLLERGLCAKNTWRCFP